MRQVFFLKILFVLSAYFTLQQFISFFIFFEPRSSVYAVMMICVVSTFLCSYLSRYRILKFVPLLFLGFSAFFVQCMVEALLMSPAWLYCIYIVARCNFIVIHGEFQKQFVRYNIIVAILIFLTIIVSLFTPINDVIIMGLIYFTCGITLNRALCHGEQVLVNPMYIFLNLISGVIFVMTIILISYPAVARSLFNLLIDGLYYIFVFPVVSILQFFMPLLNEIEPGTISTINMPRIVPPMPFAEDSVISVYRTWVDVYQNATPFAITIAIAVILMFVFLIIFIIYTLRRVFAVPTVDDKPNLDDVRYINSSEDISRKSRILQLLEISYVRRYYRKFLSLCIDRGMILRNDSTSAEIAKNAKSNFDSYQDIDHLRDVYIKSRYSGKAETKEDRIKAKKAYTEIRNSVQ